MKRALCVDDEAQIRKLLRLSLGAKGFEVREAATGFEGLQELGAARPDVVLLDLNLPDMQGIEVLRRLREFSSVPVIVLSVRDSEEDIVALLDAGADDYLTKPFSPAELLARVNAALRRRLPDGRGARVETGRLVVDLDARRALLAGEELRLTPTEWALLALLALSAGRIVTRDKVLAELWGPLAAAEAGNLRVHLSALRKKLERDSSRPEYLITEPGIGYRLAMLPPAGGAPEGVPPG